MNMKHGLKLAFIAAGLCRAVSAEVVYIDIGNAGGPVPSSYGAAYGTPGVWNTITSVTSFTLVNFAGLATDVDMTISSPGTVEMNGHADGVTGEGISQLVKDNFWVSGVTWTISLTGLADSLYDVYVYAPSHGSVFTGNFTVNGTSVSSIPGSIDNTWIEGVNYKRIQNISASGGTLTLTSSTASGYSGVAGLQIVGAVPEPATALMIGCGGALIALYRRFFGRV
jgi:hypothetical protein